MASGVTKMMMPETRPHLMNGVARMSMPDRAMMRLG
jgi:hypothetical protein